MTGDNFARINLAAVAMVGRGELKIAQLGVLAVLASHADNITGVCWPKMETLAAECGYKSAESLRPHMKALESAGLIVTRKRWKRRGKYQYESGEGWEPASNEYTVAGFPGADMSRSSYPRDSGGTYPKRTGDKLDPVELDPVIEARSPGGDPPRTIPDTWHPNGIHANSATRYGITCNGAARIFREWATHTGSKRSNWDAEFGHFLAASVGEHDEAYGGMDDRYWQLEEIGYDPNRLPVDLEGVL